MPELPEVETMRRGVLGVVGSVVRDVQRTACSRRPIAVTPRIDSLARRTRGATIDAADRIGKRVVLRLNSGDALVFEPRMTGLVLLADPPTLEHLRVRVRLEGGPAKELLYWDRRGLGLVTLLPQTELATRYGLDRLGPDALSISVDDLRGRLCGSRRAIKVALLDQRAVAGIGNLYAAEILHRAGVHPAALCSRLNAEQWRAIHQATGEILQEAIRYEGSTLSDGTYRNALNQAGGYQNHHRVYDRAGAVCGRCERGVVQRIVQAQRATFFCPQCQTKRGKTSAATKHLARKVASRRRAGV